MLRLLLSAAQKAAQHISAAALAAAVEKTLENSWRVRRHKKPRRLVTEYEYESGGRLGIAGYSSGYGSGGYTSGGGYGSSGAMRGGGGGGYSSASDGSVQRAPGKARRALPALPCGSCST